MLETLGFIGVRHFWMYTKENIFEAHRKHAYQIMANELKVSHVVVSLIYVFVQLSISMGFLFLNINLWIYFVIVIGGLIAAYLLFMKTFFILHINKI